MEVNTLDSGRTTRKRAKEYSHISTEANMKEISSTTKKKAKDRILMLRVMFTLANGRMVNRME